MSADCVWRRRRRDDISTAPKLTLGGIFFTLQALALTGLLYHPRFLQRSIDTRPSVQRAQRRAFCRSAFSTQPTITLMLLKLTKD